MMTYNKFVKCTVTALAVFALSQPVFAAGTTEDEVTVEETTDWKSDVLTKLDSKSYKSAFESLLEVETDNADTSADWNNLMGYTMRMLEMPDLEAAEKHYIKAVELKADHKGALEYYGELKLQQNDLEGAKKFVERLTEVCPEGCEELETLKKSVSEFEEKQK